MLINLPDDYFKFKTDPNDYGYKAQMIFLPCRVYVLETRQFKDGTSNWLIFTEPYNATSKEKPSLGVVRAKNRTEAVQKAQDLINNNFNDFIDLMTQKP